MMNAIPLPRSEMMIIIAKAANAVANQAGMSDFTGSEPEDPAFLQFCAFLVGHLTPAYCSGEEPTSLGGLTEEHMRFFDRLGLNFTEESEA